jgi:hypothetical protein
VADVFTDPVERAVLVADAAAELGVAGWVVEKDLWVCWVLARLHEIEDLPTLTFKGGPSLSKVHRLVDRFSEDIDLTFSREEWGFTGDQDPLAAKLSGKQRQKLIDAAVAKAVATVKDIVVPGLRRSCESIEPGSTIEIDPSDDQAVLFTFPSPGGGYGYGRPIVKAEFGARGDPWPVDRHRVRAYLEEVHEGTASTATAEVITLQPERTFYTNRRHNFEDALGSRLPTASSHASVRDARHRGGRLRVRRDRPTVWRGFGRASR